MVLRFIQGTAAGYLAYLVERCVPSSCRSRSCQPHVRRVKPDQIIHCLYQYWIWDRQHGWMEIERRACWSCIGCIIFTIAGQEAKVLTYLRLGLASSEGVSNVAVSAAEFRVTEHGIKNLLACFLERWTPIIRYLLCLGTIGSAWHGIQAIWLSAHNKPLLSSTHLSAASDLPLPTTQDS